jgi:NAD-dependent deacetylase
VSGRIEKNAQIAEAARALTGCRRLLVLAGAGLSADAGVATFRGAGGLWNEYKAEDLASLAGFHRNPDLVWEWYRERRLKVAEAEPHPGQRSLALLQKHFPGGQVMVATMNEDDLLERAGVDPVVHLHGSLFDTMCASACGWRARDREDNSLSMVPCPRCGAPTRPGSVWYGESLPPGTLEQISSFDPDGCLLVGSSCLVQPVSSIPGELATMHPVVEVNLEETHFSQVVACSLRGTAKELLPGLVDLLTSHTMRDQQGRKM